MGEIISLIDSKKEVVMKTTSVRQTLPALFLFILTLLSLTGCSILGFAVGSGIDSKGRNLKHLETGDQVKVTLKHGEVLEGTSSGVFRLGAHDYQDFINKARREVVDKSWIPNCGEEIVLDVSLSGQMKTQESRFIGFDRGKVWVIPTGTKPDTGFIELMNLRSIKNASMPSVSLLSEEIMRLESDGILPSLSAISVESKEGKQVIPLSWIVRVNSASNSAKWWGLGIGLALDVFVLPMALESMISGSGSSYWVSRR